MGAIQGMLDVLLCCAGGVPSKVLIHDCTTTHAQLRKFSPHPSANLHTPQPLC